MVDNIRSNFMNFVAVLFAGACVRLVDLILLHLGRKINVVELLKSILFYNFMLMVLLENSLQFIIFSLINIINVSYITGITFVVR